MWSGSRSRMNSRCAGVCVGAPHSLQLSSGCSRTTVPVMIVRRTRSVVPPPSAPPVEQGDLILDPNRAGRADLGAGAAADAQLRRAGEVEVGEPAGLGVGHAQRVDAHLAAGRHAQPAADADVAA